MWTKPFISTAIIATMVLMTLSSCSKSDPKEDRRSIGLLLDKFYTSLIEGDYEGFESCFADHDAFIVYGHHVVQDRKNTIKLESVTKRLKKQYEKTKSNYDKINMNGGKATFNAVWKGKPEDESEGNIFYFSKNWGGTWKIYKTE